MNWLSVVNPPHTLNYAGYMVYTLAFNEWLQQLHNPLDSNSESGGKLTLYRQLQSEPIPSGYITASISPGRGWVMAAIRDSCLPLAIETGRLQTPKIPLSCHLCIYCNSGDISHFSCFLL